MIVQRVEKHLIKQNNPFYSMFCDFTHKSKNLYNHANYLVRNEFVKNDKWLRYGDMDKLLKADLEFDDNYDYELLSLSESDEVILMNNSDDYPLLDSDFEDISTKWYELRHDSHTRRVFNNINFIDESIKINTKQKEELVENHD